MIRCGCTHDFLHDHSVAQHVVESMAEDHPAVYFVMRLHANIGKQCLDCGLYPWELIRNRYYKRRKADV